MEKCRASDAFAIIGTLLRRATFIIDAGISNLIENMKKGKAAALDGLTSEHLKYSHPILAVVICILFNLFVSHCHISESFGLSYTVPIPKCDRRKNLSL